jgi:transcription initiation factor IIE alpha subunit
MSRIVEVLELLSDSGELLSEEVAANLGISDTNSRTILYDMRRRKLVNRKGKRGAKLWGITRKGEDLLAIYNRRQVAREKIKDKG